MHTKHFENKHRLQCKIITKIFSTTTPFINGQISFTNELAKKKQYVIFNADHTILLLVFQL